MTPWTPRPDTFDFAVCSIKDVLQEIATTESAYTGTVWQLHHGDQAEHLRVGVRADRGLLVWHRGDGAEERPASSPDHPVVGYFNPAGRGWITQPPAEVDLDVMFAALAEFAASGQRPACIDWAPVPPAHSRHTAY